MGLRMTVRVPSSSAMPVATSMTFITLSFTTAPMTPTAPAPAAIATVRITPAVVTPAAPAAPPLVVMMMITTIATAGAAAPAVTARAGQVGAVAVVEFGEVAALGFGSVLRRLVVVGLGLEAWVGVGVGDVFGAQRGQVGRHEGDGPHDHGRGGSGGLMKGKAQRDDAPSCVLAGAGCDRTSMGRCCPRICGLPNRAPK